MGVGDHQAHAPKAPRPQAAQKAVQKAPSSESPTASPSTSRWPSTRTAGGDHHRLADHLRALVGLEVGRVENRYGNGSVIGRPVNSATC